MKILFVIITAAITAIALMFNHGYGNFFMSGGDNYRHTTYHDRSYRDDRRENRQPWKMQKPSSKSSSKSSQSSGRR